MTDRNKGYAGLFLILIAIGVGVWQWSEREALRQTASVLSTEAVNLENSKSELLTEFQNLKTDVAASRESADEQLKLVFPTDENLTALTRIFDDFEVKNNFETNPFFINSIQYARSSQPEGKIYRVLPVSVSVEASKKNLDKFLEFIETSGSLEGEVRLMSIENMTITYPTEDEGNYDAKFEINAYFSQEI